MRSNLHDISVEFQHRTEKAVCVREIEGGPDIWLPLAEIEITGDQRRGGIVEITAPEWLLTEKELV